MEENNNNNHYGKKPLWQWILIYIIIGAIVYAVIYYILGKNYGGYNQNQYKSDNQNQMETTNNNYQANGMKVEIVKEGSGETVKSGNTVTVNYTGTLMDGTKFDSSLNPGRTPFQFTIDKSQVIQGWHLGVVGMKVGEKRKLTISPELAYGIDGRPPVIPGNATLIFEIELLKINHEG